MEIQIFDNVQFGQLRGMNINGEAWLMATDVARKLGYTNPQKAIRDHVDEEDKTLNVSFTVNGTTPILINESGLYSLILSSKLESARKFKHWVTSEVLPQIRKTGGYIPINENEDENTIMARALIVAQKTIEQKNRLLEEQKPDVEFAYAVHGSENSILIGALAKLIAQNGIDIGQNRLFDWLRNKGYIGKSGRHRNVANQRYVDQGIFELEMNVIDTDSGTFVKVTTLVTGVGQQYFVNGFLSGKFEIKS